MGGCIIEHGTLKTGHAPTDHEPAIVRWFVGLLAAGFLVIAIFAAVFFYAIEFNPDAAKKKTAASTPGEAGPHTTRVRYWCGVTLDDEMTLGIAAKRDDRAAVLGLLARNRVYELAAGTRVFSGAEIEYGISRVRIDSGFHIGKDCYLFTNVMR